MLFLFIYCPPENLVWLQARVVDVDRSSGVKRIFRCTIRVDEPCPVCSPQIDLSSNGPSLDHRIEPGVSDANNERNTFGLYGGGGGGARINVCLKKPV